MWIGRSKLDKTLPQLKTIMQQQTITADILLRNGFTQGMGGGYYWMKRGRASFGWSPENGLSLTINGMEDFSGSGTINIVTDACVHHLTDLYRALFLKELNIS